MELKFDIAYRDEKAYLQAAIFTKAVKISEVRVTSSSFQPNLCSEWFPWFFFFRP